MSTITIASSTDTITDGYVFADGTPETAGAFLYAGTNFGGLRSYIKFSLARLPVGAVVSAATFNFYVSSAPDASSTTTINAYYARPSSRDYTSDIGIPRYTYCGSGATYNNISNITTGSKAQSLSAEALDDIEICAGGIFTLAITSTMSQLEISSVDSGSNKPTLEITYTQTPVSLTQATAIAWVPSFTNPASIEGVDYNISPTVLSLVPSFPAFTSTIGTALSQATAIAWVPSFPAFVASRAYNPDNVSGKVGVGFITQGSVSSVSGDTDATGIKLIVQSGTTLLGFGLNRDGSPFLPGGTADLGGCLSGGANNMSELTFPRPMKLTRVVVHTKNMNETRGDAFQLALMLDGSNTARKFGAPIKQNGQTERYINPGWGYVTRCVLQVSYTNTSSTTKAVPCAITKIELFGKPTGKKLLNA
jgi:hypothetical protein